MMIFILIIFNNAIKSVCLTTQIENRIKSSAFIVRNRTKPYKKLSIINHYDESNVNKKEYSY